MDIAILFGGSSYEHEISIVSAITLKKVLKEHTLSFIFVDAKRRFYLIDPSDMEASHFSSGAYQNKSKPLALKREGFVIEGLWRSKSIGFDVLLNLIHGRDGEDGKIASLLSFYGIDFIGPRLEASVLSFNKLYTKHFAESVGVQTLAYEHITKANRDGISTPFPCIIKPARLGSSIGVSVAKNSDELAYGLDVAFEFDEDVLIEPFIEGIKEYNLAGCYSDRWEFSIVEEPQKGEFLDFDKKYLDFSRNEQAKEANIDDALHKRLQEAFRAVYDPLFRGSLIRCDFFVVNETIYLNEINPIPGSLAHYLFEDFSATLSRLARALPKEPSIAVEYRYIDSIRKAKGKSS